ncbi:protease complex subunit PrcB family protein [Brevibacillus humidisoli]|uniref:protease complex subunit PrcB family protein n=1 Tax=Brevibacillus humidisoli TaxID=2895522 RepID=UPI001E30AFBC|nr:protease complex subunit PrcB family protein [Brevibacillus humidisoli]UFJ42957.1 protease complex subunit PrcB family protein [Brevibacillus humidisoli]
MKGLITLWLSLTIFLTGGMPEMTSHPSDHPQPAAAHEIASPPYPKQVEEAWQAIRKEGGYDVIDQNETRYVVIGAGQRPTGGYSLQIDRIENKNGKIIVYVVEKKPAPSALTTQAITYPSLVISLPAHDEAIDVVFVER